MRSIQPSSPHLTVRAFMVLMVLLPSAAMDAGRNLELDRDRNSELNMGDVSVQLAGFAYGPATLNVTMGTTVTWSNTDPTTHNVTMDQGPELFVSPVLKQGET